MWRTTCSTAQPWDYLGFGATGNAAGQNYVIFHMATPVRVASLGGFGSPHSGGAGRYFGTAILSGSQTNSAPWTQLVSASGGGQCAQIGPELSSDSATAFAYFKLDFCCNQRGNYQSFHSLQIAIA